MKTLKRRNQNRDPRLPLYEHVHEVRSRAFVYFIFLCLAIVGGYLLHPHLIAFLTHPLGQPLFYSSVTGGFDFVFQVSFFFGFLVSLPILLFEIVAFVSPALPVIHPKKVVIYLLCSCILLVLGISFAYFVSLPATLFFLSSFANTSIKTLISTNEYFSFIATYFVGFGVAFQLPLVLLVIDSLYPLPMRQLVRSQRLVIVICFIVAAILTPTPDIVNQCIFALPLILLYEFSLILLYWQHSKKSLAGTPDESNVSTKDFNIHKNTKRRRKIK